MVFFMSVLQMVHVTSCSNQYHGVLDVCLDKVVHATICSSQYHGVLEVCVLHHCQIAWLGWQYVSCPPYTSSWWCDILFGWDAHQFCVVLPYACSSCQRWSAVHIEATLSWMWLRSWVERRTEYLLFCSHLAWWSFWNAGLFHLVSGT